MKKVGLSQPCGYSSSWLSNSFTSDSRQSNKQQNTKCTQIKDCAAGNEKEKFEKSEVSFCSKDVKNSASRCSMNARKDKCINVESLDFGKNEQQGISKESVLVSVGTSNNVSCIEDTSFCSQISARKRTVNEKCDAEFVEAKRNKLEDDENQPAMMENDSEHQSFLESDTLLESIDLMFEMESTVTSTDKACEVSVPQQNCNVNNSPLMFDDSESITLSQLDLPFIEENSDQKIITHVDSVNSDGRNDKGDAAIQSHNKDSSEHSSVCLQNEEKNCDGIKFRKEIQQNCDTPESCFSVDILVDSSTISKARLGISERLKQRLQNNAKNSPAVSKTIKTCKMEEDMPLGCSTPVHNSLDCLSNTPADALGWCGEHDIGPFFGLSSKVQQLLISHRSISDLYDWQKECLSLEAVRRGRNLIYALPTSGGKTLVAELLIFQQLLCKKKDALLILPFVAIVQEKVRGLSPFAVGLDFIIEEYAASKGSFPPRNRLRRKSVYIATIEKANSLVNSLIEAGRIDHLGLVIVDELHMLGESGSRGGLLEMTLTKLLYVSSSTQIVGMSATLSNIEDLQKFLRAELYTNDFRPVELREYIKLSDMLYEVDSKARTEEGKFRFSKVFTAQVSDEKKKLDPDQLTDMVMEVVPDHSCLIFCPTKKNCENVAKLLCKLMPRSQREVRLTERRSLRSALQQDCAGKICPVLRETVMYGVAYHHSGLTMDERRLVEDAYLDGTLCVLVCTSTLAAGVNLPAKRVILRSPYVGTSFISRSQYKQMVGRAGRAGLDSSGESILVLTNKDKQKMLELITCGESHCLSSLVTDSSKGLRSLLLAAISLKILTLREDLERFLAHTLCYIQQNKLSIDMKEKACESLQNLINLGLVVQKTDSTPTSNTEKQSVRLEITRLGNAVCKGSIDVDRGERLYSDLQESQKCLVIDNYLHLLYLVTPYDMIDKVNIDWMIYLREVGTLSSSEQKVMSAVGICEALLVRRVSGLQYRGKTDELTVARFYQTLMLSQLWKQKSIWDVADTFRQPRGFIQQLLTSSAAFASCVYHFCEELEEFWAYRQLLESFVKKLSYCCSAELLPLMEIPGVKIGRARQLYSAGVTTLQHVARSDVEQLVKNIEFLPRRAARQIISSAQMLLKEKAEALKEEAEILMTVDQIS